MKTRALIAIGVLATASAGLFAWLGATENASHRDLASQLKAEQTKNFEAGLKPTATPESEGAANARLTAEQRSSKPTLDSDEAYKASEDLARYDRLKQKVFLTEQERRDRAVLLHDEELLISLRPLLLKDSSYDRVLEADQDRALDLLYEAMETEESPAAIEVLKAVVTDSQVENQNLAQTTRENLAGIKGEVIYHWTSLHPEKITEIHAMLPGPTSLKIWDNVMELQTANQTESKTQLAGGY